MSQNKPTNIKQLTSSRNYQPAGNVLMEGGVTTRVPANMTVLGGGKLSFVGRDRPNRSPQDMVKRINFFEQRMAARKDPANCGKCGKPRDREGRMCIRCLNTQRRRIAKSKGHALAAGESYSVEKLAGMVLQMRREMDKMHVRFKLWQKSANYRRNLHYRTNTMRKKYLKTVSHAEAMDYLAETNHAYENADEQAG